MHRTKIIVPERGEKKAVLDMAISDSLRVLSSLDERAERDKERKQHLKKKIAMIIEKASLKAGNIPNLLDEDDESEYRIEAYDISNTNGVDNVGAMVVFEGGKPLKNYYRKFKIKHAIPGDDCGSLQEVMFRRMKRAVEDDEGFNIYPDLIIADGGITQVRAIKEIIDSFGVAIPVVGLAKDDTHRTRALVYEDNTETLLKGDRMLFAYAGTIQEEVHRFAVTYHQGVRNKKMIKSGLEEIDGIGPKRRKALLKKFRNVEGIKNATYEELLNTEGMTATSAANVKTFFDK